MTERANEVAEFTRGARTLLAHMARGGLMADPCHADCREALEALSSGAEEPIGRVQAVMRLALAMADWGYFRIVDGRVAPSDMGAEVLRVLGGGGDDDNRHGR